MILCVLTSLYWVDDSALDAGPKGVHKCSSSHCFQCRRPVAEADALIEGRNMRVRMFNTPTAESLRQPSEGETIETDMEAPLQPLSVPVNETTPQKKRKNSLGSPSLKKFSKLASPQVRVQGKTPSTWCCAVRIAKSCE